MLTETTDIFLKIMKLHIHKIYSPEEGAGLSQSAGLIFSLFLNVCSFMS